MGGKHRKLRFARALTSIGVFVVGAFALAINAASLGDRWGMARAAVFVAGGACAVTVVALLISKPFRWRKLIGSLLCVGLVAGVVTFSFLEPPAKVTATPPPPTSPPVTTVVVPPNPSEVGCGNAARETVTVPDVEICVVYWCTGAVYRAFAGSVETDTTQFQYKIRPRIFNSGEDAVNISITSPSPLRLIVGSPELAARWSPPELTATAGDTVFSVDWNGTRYWAVPPNVQGDVVELPGTWSGFSTFWDGAMLDGGATFYKRLRFDSAGSAIQEGDLVFQLPYNPDGSEPTVIGLAYVTTSMSGTEMTIEHLFPRSAWPASSQPGSF